VLERGKLNVHGSFPRWQEESFSHGLRFSRIRSYSCVRDGAIRAPFRLPGAITESRDHRVWPLWRWSSRGRGGA
jgi:hypothetical protein